MATPSLPPSKPSSLQFELIAKLNTALPVEQLELVAERQRLVMVAMLVNIAANVLFYWLSTLNPAMEAAGIVIGFLAALFAIYAVFQLTRITSSTGTTIVCSILLLVPYVAVFVLLFANYRAVSFLERHGIRVGFLGVNPQNVLSHNLTPGDRMWQTQTEPESNGRVFKIAISEAGTLLSFSDVLSLLRDSADFRTFFMRQLESMPFDAFRWETPPVTTSTVDRYFECVILNSPELANQADPNAFADYFESHATDDIAVFPNLGNDAILVVPCPVDASSAYGHLAAFLRNAREDQKHALLKAVGQAMESRLSAEPVWLNTAGAGVPWLHVRLDSRPKYYGYTAYKAVRK